ncbi:MAG TPA: hypothetical protein VKM37_00490 [Balneolaceae bacterium]|nr:hypothetical protein [Balneolaceae bacterium]
MKYRIHTIIISSFFLMVASGLAINHYSSVQEGASSTEQTETLELPTIMRLLLSDIDRINEGIYTSDFSLIELGASGINEHPALSEESLELVRETLGSRMESFGKFDHIVHTRADTLRNAAQEQSMSRVLENYRIIQQGCVNCHTAFQQEIRNERLRQQHQNKP